MDDTYSFHLPVLLEEVICLLEPRSPGRYLDGTVGGGGHARAILEASAPGGSVWGLDRDTEAIDEATTALEPYRERVKLIQANFSEAKELLPGLSFEGILLDLGISSHQIDTGARGFSCDREGPLDMRMDRSAGPGAAELIEQLSEDEVSRTLRLYGEEPLSRRIAREIVHSRSQGLINTTGDLARAVRQAVPRRFERKSLVRVFQALRIRVNDELNALERALESLFELLAPEGRMAVISYHSLEDRLVKRFFKECSKACTCPPGLPVCVCGAQARARLITRKPARPSQAEIESNPRSRSARLRVLEKLAAKQS
ncbi:MAG: 16S rRNA (cytosine(1402)-N(4))-methyltransferase RsmH [Gemmatimonadota bacterium]|nr:16S rRNA (cytosine(1402)-N(4))-methyltransferase RsmH [Gemmatimonadota bacterium]